MKFVEGKESIVELDFNKDSYYLAYAMMDDSHDKTIFILKILDGNHFTSYYQDFIDRDGDRFLINTRYNENYCIDQNLKVELFELTDLEVLTHIVADVI